MSISESTLKENYQKYQDEKTATIRNIFGFINLVVSGFIAYTSFSVNGGLWAVVSFFVVAIILGAIFYIPIAIYRKSVCLPYEKWSKEYLQRQDLMQSYNQNTTQYGIKNKYQQDTLPHEIESKISELKNKIDTNYIINRNLPLIEQLSQNKWFIQNQIDFIELEVRKIPLTQQNQQNEVFNYLMSQKANKKEQLSDLYNQINKLQ